MESLIIIILYIVFFAISIAILRWALRINVIVEQLDDIALSNRKIVQNLEAIKGSLDRQDDASKQSGIDLESHHDK